MKNRLLNYIVTSPWFDKGLGFLKKIRFKKDNVSLFDVIQIFARKLYKDEIIERANGVAFSFTLAIFPAIIFLFTLIPYINIFIPEVSTGSILAFIEQFMPKKMFPVVASTIEDIIGNTRGGLLTFGALFSLYMATNGMLSLMNALNACYKTTEKRGFFKTRFIATGLTVMLAFVLILAIILLVVGNIVIDFVHSEIVWLELDAYDYFFLMALRFVVIFIVFFLAISFIYYFGPAIHYNWNFFSIGSVISTLLCLGVSYGFSFYVANFANYNKLYGSIGVLIALMIWLWILSIVLLVGYEVNAALHKAHREAPLKTAR